MAADAPHTDSMHLRIRALREVAGSRASGAPARFLVVVVAGGASPLLTGDWAFAALWALAASLSQVWVYFSLRDALTAPRFTLTEQRVQALEKGAFWSALVATSIYLAISPYLWLAGGEVGRIFAIIAVCVTALGTTYASVQIPRLAIANLGPCLVLAVSLPVLSVLAGQFSPVEAAILAAGLVMFGVFLWGTAYYAIRGRDRLYAAHIKAKDAAESARQANTAKDRFLAAVSHELRTPLHGLLGAVELLSRKPLDRDARELVDMMTLSGRSLVGMLDELLDFAKMEAGALSFRRQAFRVGDVLDRVRLLWLAAAENAGLALSVEAAPDVEGLWLFGDGERLSQALSNLVGNAVKFSEAGTIRVTAEAAAGQDGETSVTFRVIDEGGGIDADVLPRLFEPYAQGAELSDGRVRGTGLGLAIARGAARRLGGDLVVEQTSEAGTTFRLAVRLSKAPEPETTATDAEPQTLSPLSVLVADDHPVNRTVFERILDVVGHVSTVVSDGGEAVEAARNAPYDVILLDVRMPGMDGLEATRRIRADAGPNSKAPIILISADIADGDEEAGRMAGADLWLTKPISPRKLVEAMAALRGQAAA